MADGRANTAALKRTQQATIYAALCGAIAAAFREPVGLAVCAAHGRAFQPTDSQASRRSNGATF